jgi:hypothetical protein
MAGLSIRCCLVAIPKTRGLFPLDIDLPVDKIEGWLMYGRCFNSLYDTSLYSIKIK